MSQTREQANLRSQFVKSGVEYNLFIEFLKGKKYRAIIEIQFNLVGKFAFFLDWQGEPIQELIVNNQISKYEQKENLLYIDEEFLLEGLNNVQISFENEYSTSGHGLQTFIDTDDQQYIYSQCEPYHLSEIFPSFDQPDLKGYFNVLAQLPSDWQFISNSWEKSDNFKLGDKLKVVQAKGFLLEKEGFKYQESIEEKLLSTYLFALIAGPYAVIQNENYKINPNSPLRLFCRESLKAFLSKDHEEIFTSILRGMEYYEQLFQTKYPFSKYDQIFCPEFSSGAMENAGAVTVNDKYIFKEDVPLSERIDRQNTLLHELSHMWFGDLVTMKWWDDLWLNESFAEFISHLCQDRIKQFPGIDHWVFCFQRKIWGYIEDQMNTTHPIYADVKNTDEADNIFDGITYSKGAALLKQLFFTMGEEKFSNALGQYFTQFAYKNTTLNDYFAVMKGQFPGDFLVQWEQDWIMKAGLNTVSAKTSEGQIEFTQGITLEQHPHLRTQIFKIAILDNEANLKHSQQVQLDPQQHTVVKLDIQSTDFVILNYEDQSFVKTLYFDDQIKFFLTHMTKIQPSLTRLLLLRSIWDEVRDGKVSFKIFIDGILEVLNNETDDTLTLTILGWMSGGIDVYTPRKYRQELYDKLTEVIIGLLRKTDQANNNKILVLKKYLAEWGVSPNHLEYLKQYILADNLEFGSIGLDNGWTIIENIFAYLNIPAEEKQKLFDIWAEKDGTDSVRLHKRFVESLVKPDGLWQYFVNYNKEESVEQISQVMRAFNHDIYQEQLKQLEPTFYKTLPEVFVSKSSDYAKEFFYRLYPINDDLESYVQQAQTLLSQTNDDVLKKLLQQKIDQDNRRIKTYKKFLE